MSRIRAPRYRGRLAAAAVAALAALALFPAAPCRAAEALPDGPAVLAKYAQAVGGVAAWDSIHNRVTQMVISVKGTNTQMNLTEYRARPNKEYAMLDTPDGKFLSGVVGESAWEYSVAQGPKLLDYQDQADAMRDAIFDGLVHWRSGYRTAETVGVDTLPGKPCYKLTLKPRVGSPETMYFEVDTGLLAMVEGNYETSTMGTVNRKTYFSDYRKVGSVLVPYLVTQDALGQRITQTIVEIQLNTDLSDDRFDPPSQVQELIKAKPKE
ncbi:MAG TPA: hypothetical protein VMS93_06950 [Candidatus Saccharimonadales bacterium]|nr:hypothetical protein [Candidatus Saccharimonadales bacterium]